MNDSIRRNHLKTYGASLSVLLNVYNHEFRISPSMGGSYVIKEDLYLCPLCLQAFFYIKDNEIFENREFTEDHFPPESVGGTKTILVCKESNSSFGGNLDYAIKEYLELMRFVRKSENASYPVKLSFNGIPGKYNQDVYWQKGVLIKEVNFKKYPLIQKWILDYENVMNGFSLKISGPSGKIIQKALLRSAYLYSFHNWGYDFCYSHTASHIRKVINGEEAHPLSNFGVFSDVTTPNFSNGFYFNDSSAEHKTFFIFFDIKIENPKCEQKIFVLIPGGDLASWDQLTNFQSWVEKREADISLTPIFGDCVMRNNYMGYSLTWQKLAWGELPYQE